jgi:mono/diheme cytochrome c family protein
VRPIAIAVLLAAFLATASAPRPGLAEQAQPSEEAHWPAVAQKKWPPNNSMPRHHVAMAWGVPAPYAQASNPLERSSATVRRGAKVYAAHCVSCHGPSGQGDGKAGRNLSPPAGNLAWLAQLPASRWDPYIYWTVIEGGSAFGTAMPAFKDALSNDDIWAVIAYVEARLPPKPKSR